MHNFFPLLLKLDANYLKTSAVGIPRTYNPSAFLGLKVKEEDSFFLQSLENKSCLYLSKRDVPALGSLIYGYTFLYISEKCRSDLWPWKSAQEVRRANLLKLHFGLSLQPSRDENKWKHDNYAKIDWVRSIPSKNLFLAMMIWHSSTVGMIHWIYSFSSPISYWSSLKEA